MVFYRLVMLPSSFLYNIKQCCTWRSCLSPLYLSPGIDQYDPATQPKLRSRKQNTKLNTQPQRWAKSTYTEKETRHITKLFNELDIRIPFTTKKNNIQHLLQKNHKHKTHKPYSKSGVYQLTCSECKKWYIGQTGTFLPHTI
jgi:hypothetical protein